MSDINHLDASRALANASAMEGLIDIASPVDVAALWRLGFLAGEDVAAICMRWLENDIDGGDSDIASLAGERGLDLYTIRPGFERALQAIVGRSIGADEAILRALRLHLRWALDSADIKSRVGLLLLRFQGLSERRLVHNPLRVEDEPERDYAEQELGLEYLYGIYHSLDDIGHLRQPEKIAAEEDIEGQLRNAAATLYGRLSQMVGD